VQFSFKKHCSNADFRIPDIFIAKTSTCSSNAWVLKLGSHLLGGVKNSQGGREYDSDILLKGQDNDKQIVVPFFSVFDCKVRRDTTINH